MVDHSIDAKPPHSEAPTVSVIVATFNESDNIARTVDAIFAHLGQRTEVVVVDDGSTDGTLGILASMTHNNLLVIQRSRVRGLASAITRGIYASKGDIVCWIDADMARESMSLVHMIKLIEKHDVVIASRFVPGGSDERHPIRVIASRILNTFARWVLGYGIMDYDSCVVAVRRPVFDEVIPIAYGFGDFFIEFIYRCCRAGYDVHEMPYALLSREGGESKSFPGVAGFLWLGWKYALRVVASKFRPD